eukprot:122984-Amphidinium_carterae.1
MTHLRNLLSRRLSMRAKKTPPKTNAKQTTKGFKHTAPQTLDGQTNTITKGNAKGQSTEAVE